MQSRKSRAATWMNNFPPRRDVFQWNQCNWILWRWHGQWGFKAAARQEPEASCQFQTFSQHTWKSTAHSPSRILGNPAPRTCQVDFKAISKDLSWSAIFWNYLLYRFGDVKRIVTGAPTLMWPSSTCKRAPRQQHHQQQRRRRRRQPQQQQQQQEEEEEKRRRRRRRTKRIKKE